MPNTQFLSSTNFQSKKIQYIQKIQKQLKVPYEYVSQLLNL